MFSVTTKHCYCQFCLSKLVSLLSIRVKNIYLYRNCAPKIILPWKYFNCLFPDFFISTAVSQWKYLFIPRDSFQDANAYKCINVYSQVDVVTWVKLQEVELLLCSFHSFHIYSKGCNLRFVSVDAISLALQYSLTVLLLATPMGRVANYLPVPVPPVDVVLQVLRNLSVCSLLALHVGLFLFHPI